MWCTLLLLLMKGLLRNPMHHDENRQSWSSWPAVSQCHRLVFSSVKGQMKRLSQCYWLCRRRWSSAACNFDDTKTWRKTSLEHVVVLSLLLFSQSSLRAAPSCSAQDVTSFSCPLAQRTPACWHGDIWASGRTNGASVHQTEGLWWVALSNRLLNRPQWHLHMFWISKKSFLLTHLSTLKKSKKKGKNVGFSFTQLLMVIEISSFIKERSSACCISCIDIKVRINYCEIKFEAASPVVFSFLSLH